MDATTTPATWSHLPGKLIDSSTTDALTGEFSVSAVDEAIEAIEDLMRRPKEQSLFASEEIIAVLDRVDFAVLLAPATDVTDLPALAEISAAARTKTESQPAVDSVATKGDTLLDLWTGLSSLRSTLS